jgi:hypothetical protein
MQCECVCLCVFVYPCSEPFDALVARCFHPLPINEAGELKATEYTHRDGGHLLRECGNGIWFVFA